MTNTYTLAEMRAIIDAEKCVRNQWWCETHECYWSKGSIHCRKRPEVADVAAQLLATVEGHMAMKPHRGSVSDDDLRVYRARHALAQVNPGWVGFYSFDAPGGDGYGEASAWAKLVRDLLEVVDEREMSTYALDAGQRRARAGVAEKERDGEGRPVSG